MAILTFPAIAPASADWRLQPNTAVFTSPLNGSVQTYERPGARWVVSLNFPNLTPTEGRLMASFMTSLRGAAGRFYLHDHTLPTPRGVATGTPVFGGTVDFADPNTVPSARAYLITGWTPNITGILLAGDMIGIRGQIFMVVADANSDALGEATVFLEAPPRVVLQLYDAVTTNKPTAVFRLKNDNQAAWRVQPLFYNMALVCEEVF